MKAFIFATAAGALLLSGCLSTPQSRADKNPDLFESFTVEQKETILKGEVELGFTPEMVLMAAGIPDRKAKKRSELGTTEVWTYYKYYPRPIYGYGGYHPYFSYSRFYGGYYRNSFWGPSSVIVDAGERENNLVVDFQDGKVVAYEMVQ